MTPDELRALGLALYGYEWQSPLARALGVTPRSVRFWASGQRPVPPPLVEKIAALTGARDALDRPDWPRDEWIAGDGGGRDLDGARCEYIVHTRYPRFIARIVDESGDTPEPRHETGGVSYSIGADTLLCEFVWIDRPPGPAAMHRLLEAAAGAIDMMVGE